MSTMSSKWKRMVMTKATRKWATSAWSEQPPPNEADDDCAQAEASPPTISDFSSVFGGQDRTTAVTVPISNPPNSRREMGGGSPKVATGILRQVGRGSQKGTTARQGVAPTEPDIMTIIRTMMEAQSAANVAMSVAFNTNMIAFHTATAQALAAKNGDKDSKLTVAKKKILQACCGHADKDTFTTPGVYMDMDVEGGTTDALGRILRRRMKTIVGSYT